MQRSKIAPSMLAVPAAPFHSNTYHMLCWVDCPELLLLNGYSARSTGAFGRQIEVGRRYGRASTEQIAVAAGMGADYLCLLRGRVPVAIRTQVRSGYRVLFENNRFLVVALQAAAY